MQIQQGYFPDNKLYAVYTDRGFARQQCVVNAHRPGHGGVPPLAPMQVLENFRLKAVRITVEWSYGIVSNVFRICRTFSPFRIFHESRYACEQLRVSFLLTNCYTVFHHSQIGAIGTFGVEPPPINNYLAIH